MKLLAVQMAREVLDLYNRNVHLEAENERLRKFEKMYDDLLMSSIKHGEMMTARSILLMLNKGDPACLVENQLNGTMSTENFDRLTAGTSTVQGPPA